MKRKLLFFIFLAVVTTVVGYSMHMSKNRNILSDIMLANVDALANNDEGGFEITCNQYKNVSPGNCWQMYGECRDGWFIRWDDCRFSGRKYDRCLTPCD